MRPGNEVVDLLPVPLAQIPPSKTAAGEVAAQSDGDQPELRSLRVDMQLMMWKIDQLHRDTQADEVVQAAQEIRTVVEALPQQVREAVSSALEVQRREMVNEFASIHRKIVEDIGQLQEAVNLVPRDSNGTAVSVTDLDARFQWLVDALSERFVILGNELARIEREVTGDQESYRARNGGAANGAKSLGNKASA